MCCKVAPPNILRRNCFLPDIEFSTLCRLGRRGEGEGNVNLQHYTRTPVQSQIALLWLESSPLGGNRIARTVAAARGVGLWENARLFGLLNLALADRYIANFDTKAHYNRWRPITAIREAATDGNPDTSADPTWTPLADTPAGPEYDSGHSLRRSGSANYAALLWRRQHRFHNLQHDNACRQHLQRCSPGNALLHQFFSGC